MVSLVSVALAAAPFITMFGANPFVVVYTVLSTDLESVRQGQGRGEKQEGEY
jgi:hypothetical protein